MGSGTRRRAVLMRRVGTPSVWAIRAGERECTGPGALRPPGPGVRVAGELGGSSPADAFAPFSTEVEAHILGGRMRNAQGRRSGTNVQLSSTGPSGEVDEVPVIFVLIVGRWECCASVFKRAVRPPSALAVGFRAEVT